MGSARGNVLLSLGFVFLVLQVWRGDCEESTDGQCQPGFSSNTYVFMVNRRELAMGRTLGKVHFDDCSGRKRAVYDSSDSHIRVMTDGTVIVKRHMKLHDGIKSFAVHAWDSNGKKFSTSIAVLNQGHEHGHHHHRHDHGHQHNQEPNVSPDVEMGLPVLTFPMLSSGRSRQKREWVIPPMNVPENDRGPFPKKLVQIKSSKAKEIKVLYSITGQGADEPPVEVFKIERETGWLLVTKPLDREAQDSYTLISYAVSSNGDTVEAPMELSIVVIDQNDNKPQFTKQIFEGSVPEGVPPGTSVMTLTAEDLDDPNTENAMLGYSVVSQEPKIPAPEMFTINQKTGVISTITAGLDRENVSQYTLIVQVADQEGRGLSNTATAVISVTDSNDNAPQFEPHEYQGSAPENTVGHEVARLSVTEKDEPHSKAWIAVYRIVKGNAGGFFNITTDSENNQGILKTVKELDFETTNQYILLVTAENQVPFAVQLPTSTATVTVSVVDQNEAPIFTPAERTEQISEDLTLGQTIASFPAIDPDKAQRQVVKYRIGSDPAGWLEVDPETGIIRSKAELDRESSFVKNNKYKALILAFDDGTPPATGTGTLVLDLLDVNDNGPEPDPRVFEICFEEPVPAILKIIDKDLPPNTFPFEAKLALNSDRNWTAAINDKGDSVILNLKRKLEPDIYNINLQLTDAGGKPQLTVVQATVCECRGEDVQCKEKVAVAGVGLPTVLAILGAILALLILLLLLLLFMKRKKKVKEPLLPEEDIRDNVYYYDEEGGGEEDQEYDLSQLHRGLDNRPEVTRNDVIPTLMPAPQYRPRPANPDEIGNFIDENLKAADNDPTAPPYDSLLVFDYEGGGSDAGSLSSLNSSSSGGDQDYDYLNQWGPRFKKLADMYGGEED